MTIKTSLLRMTAIAALAAGCVACNEDELRPSVNEIGTQFYCDFINPGSTITVTPDPGCAATCSEDNLAAMGDGNINNAGTLNLDTPSTSTGEAIRIDGPAGAMFPKGSTPGAIIRLPEDASGSVKYTAHVRTYLDDVLQEDHDSATDPDKTADAAGNITGKAGSMVYVGFNINNLTGSNTTNGPFNAVEVYITKSTMTASQSYKVFEICRNGGPLQ